MSSLNDNPFADPFADPAVRAATQPTTDSTEEFNPFAARSQPATHSTPQPSSSTARAMNANDELFRKQEELQRKAEELKRREEELERRQRGAGTPVGAGGSATQKHNWPPLPTFVPIEPCFYQDIEVEIPVNFQKTVSLCYYVFLTYVGALAINVLASLFFFTLADGGIGIFFLSIIQLVIFSPCSFVFWFRPVYKAFRNDSSFNFMVFFFVLFFQSLFCLVQALGFSEYACGWVNAIGAYKNNVFAGLVMTVSAIAFSAALGGMVVALLKVHRLYRGGGFSIDKARREFTDGVMSDSNVRAAASSAATAAAGAAVQNAARGGKF